MKKLLFILFLFPFAAYALNWKIIPEKSELKFTASQNNSPVNGKFEKFIGDIIFDPNNLSQNHIKIIIFMDSVSTSFKDIQDLLKTSDWFNSADFPQATFSSADFTKTGDNTYLSNGKLTLRDKTLPLTLDFTIKNLTDSHATVSGKANLKRNDFGVGQHEWADTSEIKDEVTVTFTIEAST